MESPEPENSCEDWGYEIIGITRLVKEQYLWWNPNEPLRFDISKLLGLVIQQSCRKNSNRPSTGHSVRRRSVHVWWQWSPLRASSSKELHRQQSTWAWESAEKWKCLWPSDVLLHWANVWLCGGTLACVLRFPVQKGVEVCLLSPLRRAMWQGVRVCGCYLGPDKHQGDCKLSGVLNRIMPVALYHCAPWINKGEEVFISSLYKCVFLSI